MECNIFCRHILNFYYPVTINICSCAILNNPYTIICSIPDLYREFVGYILTIKCFYCCYIFPIRPPTRPSILLERKGILIPVVVKINYCILFYSNHSSSIPCSINYFFYSQRKACSCRWVALIGTAY